MSTDAANGELTDMRALLVPSEARLFVRQIGGWSKYVLEDLERWFGKVELKVDDTAECGICLFVPTVFDQDAVLVSALQWMVIEPFFVKGGQDALVYQYQTLERNFVLRPRTWFDQPGRIEK